MPDFASEGIIGKIKVVAENNRTAAISQYFPISMEIAAQDKISDIDVVISPRSNANNPKEWTGLHHAGTQLTRELTLKTTALVKSPAMFRRAILISLLRSGTSLGA